MCSDPDRAFRSTSCSVDPDRKSTRLNSSHLVISYAVFCLKKKGLSTRRTAIGFCCVATGRTKARDARLPGAMSSCAPRCTIFFFFFNDTATTEIYTLSLHDALPIYQWQPAAAEAGNSSYAFASQ